jgi:Bacterial aa3 type cytochrome c oxidase subunit IV
MAAQSHTTNGEFRVHAETYHRFMLAVKWFAIHFAAVAAFLTLWFATPAGFFWGLITGLVVLAVGIYAMTHGLAHSSEDETWNGPELPG